MGCTVASIARCGSDSRHPRTFCPMDVLSRSMTADLLTRDMSHSRSTVACLVLELVDRLRDSVVLELPQRVLVRPDSQIHGFGQREQRPRLRTASRDGGTARTARGIFATRSARCTSCPRRARTPPCALAICTPAAAGSPSRPCPPSVALISIGHARLRSRRSVSSSGISSSRGAMFSNSVACATMWNTSGMDMWPLEVLVEESPSTPA